MGDVQAIVFDFDGVLAESVHVKGEAFYQLYEDSGQDIQQKVLEHHLAHGGVSRFDKIRHYQSEFLGKPPSEEEVQKIADRFSDLVEEKVVQSDWVAGAKEFLEEFYQRLPLFVASATPQEELERIVAARGMSGYFKAVFGSPVTKAEHLKSIMAEYGYDPQKIVMVGDTISDYNAAQEAVTRFIGRIVAGLDRPFPEDVKAIDDLTTLADVINV